jgi:tetratricopeptide (TPR) repeat protein
MTDDIEELLAYARIGLETGYYEQAREYFKQALELDATNREAMKGLARANEILSRRTVAVPIEAEIRTEPPLAERISLKVNSALEWIRKRRKERADRIAERRRLAAEEREQRAKEMARQREDKAGEIERLKQAWAEQRAQRGNVPLQLGQCPECGSMDSYKHKEISGVGCLAMVLFFPVSLLVYLLLPDTFLCRVCGAKWKG